MARSGFATRLKRGTHHGRDLLGSSVPRRAFVTLSLTVAPCAPLSTFALNAESRPRIQSSTEYRGGSRGGKGGKEVARTCIREKRRGDSLPGPPRHSEG